MFEALEHRIGTLLPASGAPARIDLCRLDSPVAIGAFASAVILEMRPMLAPGSDTHAAPSGQPTAIGASQPHTVDVDGPAALGSHVSASGLSPPSTSPSPPSPTSASFSPSSPTSTSLSPSSPTPKGVEASRAPDPTVAGTEPGVHACHPADAGAPVANPACQSAESPDGADADPVASGALGDDPELVAAAVSAGATAVGLAGVDWTRLGIDELVSVIEGWRRVEAAAAAQVRYAAAELAERAEMNPALLALAGADACIAPDELAGTLGISLRAARHLVAAGRQFNGPLADVGHALAAGVIDAGKAQVFCDVLTDLPVQVVLAVVDATLPQAPSWTHHRLKEKLRSAVVAASGSDAHAAHVHAAAGRHLRRPDPLPDGMARLVAILPALDAQTIWTACDAAAWSARTTGDPRTLDQLRADALTLLAQHALATGTIGADPDGSAPGRPDLGGASEGAAIETRSAIDGAPIDTGSESDGARSDPAGPCVAAPADPGGTTKPAPPDVAEDAGPSNDAASPSPDAPPPTAPPPMVTDGPASPRTRAPAGLVADVCPDRGTGEQEWLLPDPSAGAGAGVPPDTVTAAPPGAATKAPPGAATKAPRSTAAEAPPGAPAADGPADAPPADDSGRVAAARPGPRPGASPAGPPDLPVVKLGRPARARPAVQVVIAGSTLLGLDDHPATLLGYGAIDATTARQYALLQDATWRRILTDPATGRTIDVSEDTYRPSDPVARFVRARDPHCVVPGCSVPSDRCDLDHVVRFPWGPTSIENLAPVCRRHHLLKTHCGYRLARQADGTTTWTTPRGRTLTAPEDRPLPAAAPLDPAFEGTPDQHEPGPSTPDQHEPGPSTPDQHEPDPGSAGSDPDQRPPF